MKKIKIRKLKKYKKIIPDFQKKFSILKHEYDEINEWYYKYYKKIGIV